MSCVNSAALIAQRGKVQKEYKAVKFWLNLLSTVAQQSLCLSLVHPCMLSEKIQANLKGKKNKCLLLYVPKYTTTVTIILSFKWQFACLFSQNQILPSARSFALDFSKVKHGFFSKASYRYNRRKAFIFPISGRLLYETMVEVGASGNEN